MRNVKHSWHQKELMLHADRNDAILNQILHDIIDIHPIESFATACKRHIERVLAREAEGIDVTNHSY